MIVHKNPATEEIAINLHKKKPLHLKSPLEVTIVSKSSPEETTAPKSPREENTAPKSPPTETTAPKTPKEEKKFTETNDQNISNKMLILNGESFFPSIDFLNGLYSQKVILFQN